MANKAQSMSSSSRLPKAYSEKELLAALSNLGDKRSNNLLFDEYSKQALQSMTKGKGATSSGSNLTAHSQAAFMKKQTESAAKSSLSLFESLKLLTGKPTKDSANLLQKNLKTMLEEHPELLSANNSTLTSLLSSPLHVQSANLASLSSPSSASINTEDKSRSNRSKRTRSQYESPNSSTQESSAKRQLLNASKNSFMDPKNPNFKYLSTLLDKNDGSIEAKIKNFININEKQAFKSPPVSMPSTSSSVRTRTSDKRSSGSSSSNFSNLNASNLLNNLSLAAAAASTGSGSSKQQQQTAASLLANSYVNAMSSNKAAASNYANASNFSNFGFNPSMLASFPSMKMFLDAAAAAAAATAVSKNSSSACTIANSSAANSTYTTASSTSAPSLSSFANMLGGMNNLTNPLMNFSNFANLAALGQTGGKKEGSTGGVDFASLFANNLASATANLGSEDKSTKTTKTSSSQSSTSTTASNKNKTGLNPSAAAAAAASMLGSSGLGSSALPFLYSNPNFPMSALYNPLSLGNFGLSSPFLNNPNLMNGLANFSNVFTSTTSTLSSNSNQPSKSRSASSKATTKVASSRATASSTSTSAASGLSLASGLLAGSNEGRPSNSALDSDDESLKSLMGNDEEDDLNGDFESEHVEETKRKKSKSSPQKQTPPKEGKSRRSTSK